MFVVLLTPFNQNKLTFPTILHVRALPLPTLPTAVPQQQKICFVSVLGVLSGPVLLALASHVAFLLTVLPANVADCSLWVEHLRVEGGPRGGDGRGPTPARFRPLGKQTFGRDSAACSPRGYVGDEKINTKRPKTKHKVRRASYSIPYDIVS